MELITDPPQAAFWSASQRMAGNRVGLVPTMGALHAGHVALVHRALADSDRVMCSIFVNPLQFNDPADLARYPRQLEQDLAVLGEAGCHAVFAPQASAMWADFSPRAYDLGGLDNRWEGPMRPGHFQGVANVVERLFHYARPDTAFFGEKDRQQLTIIHHLVHSLLWPEKIVGCPTMREPDGLAMSSRNALLSKADRAIAPVLYEALLAIRSAAASGSTKEAIAQGQAVLASRAEVQVEYLAIVRAHDLEPLTELHNDVEAVALVAARLGGIRLIDNIALGRAEARA